MVLSVADYISADREYPGGEALRAVARGSLQEAIIVGVAFTVPELMSPWVAVASSSNVAYYDAGDVMKGTEKRE